MTGPRTDLSIAGRTNRPRRPLPLRRRCFGAGGASIWPSPPGCRRPLPCRLLGASRPTRFLSCRPARALFITGNAKPHAVQRADNSHRVLQGLAGIKGELQRSRLSKCAGDGHLNRHSAATLQASHCRRATLCARPSSAGESTGNTLAAADIAHSLIPFDPMAARATTRDRPE